MAWIGYPRLQKLSDMGKLACSIQAVPLLGRVARRVRPWVKAQQGRLWYAHRLRPSLRQLLAELQVRECDRLADSFADAMIATSLERSGFVVRNISCFLTNIEQARRTSPLRALPFLGKPGAPLRLLLISALSPCQTHAGGLRVYEIIQHLERLNGYAIYLYARRDADWDGRSREPLAQACRACRFASDGQFGESDLKEWLAELGLTADSFDLVQFEWVFCLDRFSGLYASRPTRLVTHQENQLRRRSLELNRLSPSVPARERSELLCRIARDACLESIAYARIPVHIVLTPEDAEFVRQFGASRVEVIPTGLSEEFVARGTPERAPNPGQLCFLAYFGHAPNLEAAEWLLEQVLPRVRAKVPEARLLVVGSGDVSRLRARFGSAANFTGQVESVVPFISESEVCLAPLISGAGFRGKVNQYSILGRPTVATSIAVSGLAYRDGESILVADTPEDFAGAVVRLLRDQVLRESLRRSAQEVARAHYCWDPIISRLDGLYRECACREAARALDANSGS